MVSLNDETEPVDVDKDTDVMDTIEDTVIDPHDDTEFLDAIVDEDIYSIDPIVGGGNPEDTPIKISISKEPKTVMEIPYRAVRYFQEALSNWITPDDYVPNSQACTGLQKQLDVIKRTFVRCSEQQQKKITRLEEEENRLNGKIAGLSTENGDLNDKLLNLGAENEHLNECLQPVYKSLERYKLHIQSGKEKENPELITNMLKDLHNVISQLKNTNNKLIDGKTREVAELHFFNLLYHIMEGSLYESVCHVNMKGNINLHSKPFREQYEQNKIKDLFGTEAEYGRFDSQVKIGHSFEGQFNLIKGPRIVRYEPVKMGETVLGYYCFIRDESATQIISIEEKIDLADNA